MIRISVPEWQIGAAAVGFIVTTAAGIWLLTRKRLTPDEVEQHRREMLVTFGRIVDGLLLDNFQLTDENGGSREMLLYAYEISGVRYECSQDISPLLSIMEPEMVKVGMPCSIRYQPGTPENSILVAEGWSGLRSTVPLFMPHVEESPFGELLQARSRKLTSRPATNPEAQL
jgi:hypothetical protein